MPIDATRTLQARKRPTLPTLAAIVIAATASLPARAAELRPMQRMSLQLGELHGIAYYTVEEAGYSVVATLAAKKAHRCGSRALFCPDRRLWCRSLGIAGAKAIRSSSRAWATACWSRQPLLVTDRPMTTRTSRPVGRTGAARFRPLQVDPSATARRNFNDPAQPPERPDAVRGHC
jgi:hypothetical protein